MIVLMHGSIASSALCTAGETLAVDKGEVKWVIDVDEAQSPQDLRRPNRNETEEVHNKTDTPDQQVLPPPSKALNTEPYSRNEGILGTNVFVYSALIGTAVIALIQLLQVTILDLPLRVGLFSFAVAIPLLAGSLMCDNMKADYPINIDTYLEFAMNWGGILASYVGIACLFWHFGFYVALTFFLFSIGAYIAWGHIGSKLEKMNSRRV
jgi:hypothetical protein